MKYYIDRDADDVADEVWGTQGTIPGTTAQKPTPEYETEEGEEWKNALKKPR